MVQLVFGSMVYFTLLSVQSVGLLTPQFLDREDITAIITSKTILFFYVIESRSLLF